MSVDPNAAATDPLPFFIAAADGSDPMTATVAIFLVAVILGAGVLFLRLHTLPERMAHRGRKLQFEIVAILGLLALFTHTHMFWVAGLLLAAIDLPDFVTPLRRIARGVESLAGLEPEKDEADGDMPEPASDAHGAAGH